MWVWVALLALSLLFAGRGAGHPIGITLLLGFVNYFCRILALAIFVRAILSWFPISRNSLGIVILDDITEPLLYQLQRVIPRFGMFDITPLVAIAILYFIPALFNLLLA